MHSIRRNALWTACCSILAMMSTVIAPASASASAPSATVHPAGTQHAVSHIVKKLSPAESQGGSKGNDHYCDGCTPPLLYSGGQVMDTTGPTGVTITPIYWIPDGYAQPFPESYPTIINQYIADVAAASGTDSNVYSINSEYYQVSADGTQTNLEYKITAGEPIIDTQPFPADGCTPASDQYLGCITDDQLRTELTRITTERGVTTDLANFYPVFLPPAMETADLDGSNSDSAFCGYHRAFGEGSSEIVYGNEPYQTTGCDAGQAPNGDVVADGAIGTLSHEINEALTDPTDTTAWNDSSGHEIGDICAGDYGTPLGATDPANESTTQYNQEINGNKYYTQTEFSNAAFANFGIGNGCVQNAAASGGSAPADATTSVGQVFSYAYPNSIDADGTTTSAISTSISDRDNNIIEGDTVNFSVYAIQGTGECGTLSQDNEVTGADGYANIEYTASTDDVVCAVVATDTMGGQSSTASIYQGATQSQAPTAADTFPTQLEAGADPTLFTTTFTNPSSTDIVNAQVDFSIFPGDTTTTDVTADQVQLSWSTNGADGPFTPVLLSGSTVGEGGIEGTVGDAGGATIPAGGTLEVTYQFAVDGAVVPDGNGPLLSMEAYLDQVNPGSGAGTNLADTTAGDIEVTASGVTPVPATVDTSSAATGDTTVDTSGDQSAVSDTAGVDATADTTSDTVAPAPSDSSSSAGIIIGIIAVVVVIGIVVLVLRKRRT